MLLCIALWYRVVDRDVVATHRNPADVAHRAPPLPSHSPQRWPGRSALLSLTQAAAAEGVRAHVRVN